jgi:hypothetical protein
LFDVASRWTNEAMSICPMQAQHASDIAFATALVSNLILLVVFFAGFLVFRNIARLRLFFVARSDFPPPSDGLFGWAVGALAVSDEELERKRGLDFVAYMLTLKCLFWITVGYAFFGFIILVPVHATAGGGLTGISLIGLGNVPDGSGEDGFWLDDCLLTCTATQRVWRRTLSLSFSTRYWRARCCMRCTAESRCCAFAPRRVRRGPRTIPS